MKRLLAGVVVIALLAPWLLFGQEKPQKSAPSKGASVEQALIELEDQGNNAMLNGDVAFFERILADDFTSTDPGGSVSTRAQGIADMKSGTFKIISSVNDDYQVRVYGKAAVVMYRATIKAQYQGEDISGRYRWTDTWVKHGRRWQCVASHGSKIAEVK